MIVKISAVEPISSSFVLSIVNNTRLQYSASASAYLSRRFLYISSTLSKEVSLESKWIPYIRQHDKKRNEKWTNNSKSVQRSYILSMFPYPSGNLHLGHLRVYTVADVLARYKAMRGFAVLQPMGWDAFGLPAENAAIDRDILPSSWTSRNIQQMREQMESTMLLSLDWSREISTCDPTYYKWTQWIFLKLYKAGLAYRRSAFVNWDPVDQTVLADELVDAQGRSWRSGAVVERIPLCQWYFRTSLYSQSLLDGLKDIEGNQWRDVVQMQRGWLGTLDGTQIELDLAPVSCSASSQSTDCNLNPRNASQKLDERVTVFTKQPHLVVADLVSHVDVTADSVYFAECYRMPEHQRGLNTSRKILLLRADNQTTEQDSRKLSISSTAAASPWPEQLAISVVHPFTGRIIPMVRQPGVHVPLSVAFPELIRTVLDNETQATVKLLDLPHPPASVTSSKSSNSSDSPQDSVLNTPVPELDGVRLSEALDKSMKLLKKVGRGGFWSSESRTDWLVSRQRYWGTPIPIVHCRSCGTVPVPENQLPVTLPPLEHAFKRGAAPLKENLKWRKTTCPKCGGEADRETDTLDTFVDSSWYYLRYLDPKNTASICEANQAQNGLPVDVYVGGIEHAIRHLFYARFISHFLHDLGIMPCREPFLRFLPIGLVLAQTFMEPLSGRYVASSQVDCKEVKKGQILWTEQGSGQSLQMHWDKMSKSKLNGVDPTEVVRRHGLETVRLTMLANVGPHRSRMWQEDDGVMRGIIGWKSKLLRLSTSLVEFAQSQLLHGGWQLLIGPQQDPLWDEGRNAQMRFNFRSTHENTLRLVNSYLNETFVISAAIARLQETTEMLRKTSISSCGPGPQSFLYLRIWADLIVMLTPLAPVLSCELWSNLQNAYQLQSPSSALHNQLETLRGSHSTWSMHWPYDLTKSVLDQPFPVFTNRELDAADAQHTEQCCSKDCGNLQTASHEK